MRQLLKLLSNFLFIQNSSSIIVGEIVSRFKNSNEIELEGKKK